MASHILLTLACCLIQDVHHTPANVELHFPKYQNVQFMLSPSNRPIRTNSLKLSIRNNIPRQSTTTQPLVPLSRHQPLLLQRLCPANNIPTWFLQRRWLQHLSLRLSLVPLLTKVMAWSITTIRLSSLLRLQRIHQGIISPWLSCHQQATFWRLLKAQCFILPNDRAIWALISCVTLLVCALYYRWELWLRLHLQAGSSLCLNQSDTARSSA